MSQPALQLGILLGDDIGLEVVPEAVKVVDAAARAVGLPIVWRDVPIGRRALDTLGTTLPEGTLEVLDGLDGWVLGPIGHREYPKVAEAINPHPILRKHFDLFANIRPTKSYRSLPSLHQDVDLVIVRENNEGFQPDRNVVAGSGEFLARRVASKVLEPGGTVVSLSQAWGAVASSAACAHALVELAREWGEAR